MMRVVLSLVIAPVLAGCFRKYPTEQDCDRQLAGTSRVPSAEIAAGEDGVTIITKLEEQQLDGYRYGTDYCGAHALARRDLTPQSLDMIVFTCTADAVDRVAAVSGQPVSIAPSYEALVAIGVTEREGTCFGITIGEAGGGRVMTCHERWLQSFPDEWPATRCPHAD